MRGALLARAESANKPSRSAARRQIDLWDACRRLCRLRAGGLRQTPGRRDFERRMADRHAQELTFFVGHLQEPTSPSPRIAYRLGSGQLANNRFRLAARLLAAGQFDAFLVRHEAIAEGKMEEIMRHDPCPSSANKPGGCSCSLSAARRVNILGHPESLSRPSSRRGCR